MITIAIDPGTEQSAVVWFEDGKPDITKSKIDDNTAILDYVRMAAHSDVAAHLAIEMVASYGMAVGKETFETVRWIGRFEQAWKAVRPNSCTMVYRKDVKLHLCGQPRAKDANIRQAILDKYPRSGGGTTPQIGTKKAPGPLYGMKSHLWSALAVAITFEEAILCPN